MKRSLRLLLATLAAVFSALTSPAKLADPLEAQAWAALKDVLEHDRSAAMLHAADAFIAFDRNEPVHTTFTATWEELQATPRKLGTMRQRAATTPDAAEKAALIRQLEAFAAEDSKRTSAFENLCKLHYLRGYQFPPAVIEIARQAVATATPSETIFPYWVLAISGDPSAAPKLSQMVASPDLKVRLLSSYALRSIRPTDPAVVARVSDAADQAKGNGADVAYLLSSALVLAPHHAHAEQWKSGLFRLLITGSGQDRYQACHALLPYVTESDLARLTPLLTNEDPDARVSSAWLILQVLTPNAKKIAARQSPPGPTITKPFDR